MKLENHKTNVLNRYKSVSGAKKMRRGDASTITERVACLHQNSNNHLK